MARGADVRAGAAMLLFIAWRNLWRYPVRSALTLSALAGSLVLVILYAAMIEGFTRQMLRQATELTTGHLQVHRAEFVDNRDLYATIPWSYLDALEGSVAGASLAPRLYTAGLASTEDSSTGVLIEAVDPAREGRVTRRASNVREGEPGLGIEAGGGGRRLVAVGGRLARNLGVGPGSELVLVTQAADGSIGNGLFAVGAVLGPLDPGFDRLGVMMSVDAYRELMYLEDGFHELAVAADDPADLAAVRAGIESALAELAESEPLDELGGPAVARDWRELNPAVAELLDISRVFVYVIGVVLVLLASLGLLNTMMMAVHERTHEFGILLALGMKGRWLLAMVLLESFLLSLAAVAVGSALGAWAGSWFEDPGLDFSDSIPDGYDWGGIAFEPVFRGHLLAADVAASCAVVVLVAQLAALIPSWRVLRMRPVEALGR